MDLFPLLAAAAAEAENLEMADSEEYKHSIGQDSGYKDSFKETFGGNHSSTDNSTSIPLRKEKSNRRTSRLSLMTASSSISASSREISSGAVILDSLINGSDPHLEENLPVVSKFGLLIRQQPSRSRMIGFGIKVDRRPVDPPPIVQLITPLPTCTCKLPVGLSPEMKKNHICEDISSYLLFAKLCHPFDDIEVHGPKDLNALSSNQLTRMNREGGALDTSTGSKNDAFNSGSSASSLVTGSLVASPFLLKDENNKPGIFFVFPDLSIRPEGYYRLKFSLYKIASGDAHVVRVDDIFSKIFRVFPPKEFPGMEGSTLLSRKFASQGVKIRIRQNKKKRRGDDSADNSMTTPMTPSSLFDYANNMQSSITSTEGSSINSNLLALGLADYEDANDDLAQDFSARLHSSMENADEIQSFALQLTQIGRRTSGQERSSSLSGMSSTSHPYENSRSDVRRTNHQHNNHRQTEKQQYQQPIVMSGPKILPSFAGSDKFEVPQSELQPKQVAPNIMANNGNNFYNNQANVIPMQNNAMAGPSNIIQQHQQAAWQKQPMNVGSVNFPSQHQQFGFQPFQGQFLVNRGAMLNQQQNQFHNSNNAHIQNSSDVSMEPISANYSRMDVEESRGNDKTNTSASMSLDFLLNHQK